MYEAHFNSTSLFEEYCFNKSWSCCIVLFIVSYKCVHILVNDSSGGKTMFLDLLGDVGECDQGHFKNKSDDSICIPHTK